VDDPALLARIGQGDESAFTELVTRHHPSVVRVAGYYVADHATAEDVAQDTWLAVLKGLDGFEGRSSFTTWLLRIAANRAKSRGVGDRRIVPVDPSEPWATVDGSRFDGGGAWSDPPAPFTDLVEGRIDQQAVAVALGEALAELPEPQRTVVTLRDVDGLSTTEVSELLELTEANVRVIVHRARARLRARLEELAEGSRR
jgi:RNA polymerase sigma-70 factor (ECF subfamily)